MYSSQRALDLIVDFEIGDALTYVMRGSHPEWPGGLSGVTWGIGYDGGYQTAARIYADWRFQIGDVAAERLTHVAGVHGAAAQMLLPSVKDIVVPFKAAMAVFQAHDVPRYEDMVLDAYPTAAELPPDCFGALLSLVYNRGSGLTDAENDTQQRRREMREIRECGLAHDWLKVPDLIRSMARLWSNGLVARRDKEAELFEQGLVAWIEAGKPTQPPGGAVA